ncbi:MAG: flagellin [Sedimentisphaerales bacterium]|nr:flagellin [Sedimentisphaerales bacterium]
MYLNNTNFNSAISNLTRIGAQLAISNQRLTTGKRVNTAADDPAGIVAMSNLNQQIAQIDAATRNGQRISSMIDTADGAMSQMASLIGTIQSNTLAAAGSTVTAEERAAYQAEIDAAIDSIDTLVNTTSFNGRKLLDGTTGYATSGVDSAKLSDVRVNAANTGNGGSVTVDVDVVSKAEKAVVKYSTGALVDDVTMTVTGNNGTVEFNFASGTNMATITSTIAAQSDATGIDATLETVLGVTSIYFRSQDYGSDQTVNVNVTDGTFNLDGGVTSDTGVDATVTINGQTTTTDGLSVIAQSGTTAVRFTLEESFGTVAGGSTSFTISGNGAGFSLGAVANDQINYGLSSMNTNYLGNDTLGYLNSLRSNGANALSSGNYYAAYNIATTASQQVSTERARMGAIKTYTVDATLSSYAATKNALTQSLSSIEDVDYVAETARNQQLQLLYQAGISVLSSMGQNTSSILSLLS